ncbi:UDP-N-acetylgalactosamine-undecaprenyl-phosphate N-acetylgalactosaminephosphotransferase [Planctomycetes bacterium CA13]|uniref:UDP-N-acetylgalactosamine-undecaprenyl-phosphate N-acetylgalactosaminephosphotransferase n=1 Tax=Novipirellula herctigrandis TaxID=2527986 RepID=A0A5C5Z0N8_9BACT|nr:UDP-N-acetylgalactosamine-undecaprenyl-phosphate N-acetylgalactosaminephosphotransferase [Planctomycetes bacterium CA13]
MVTDDVPGSKNSFRWSKRVLDVFASLVGMIFLSPLMAFVAISIRIFDGRPVLFRQERIGLHGEPFVLWKFRTMRQEAESMGPKVTVSGDSRITAIGNILRKTKMDELPQLWNVLRGEMTLVGPRPEVREYVDLYNNEQREVLRLVPGITDPASLKYFDENSLLSQQTDPMKFYIDSVMPDKIEINLDYAKRATLLSDLRLVLKTITRVFSS